MSCNRFGIGPTPKNDAVSQSEVARWHVHRETSHCGMSKSHSQLPALPAPTLSCAASGFVLLRVQIAQKDQFLSMGDFATNLKVWVNRYMSGSYAKRTSMTACCSGRPNSP